MSAEVTAVAVSPDGKQLVSGSSDKTQKSWNVNVPKQAVKEVVVTLQFVIPVKTGIQTHIKQAGFPPTRE